MKRLPTRRLVPLAVAVASLGSLSACATFTDDNVVARVGDSELSNDDFAEILRSVEGDDAAFAPINDDVRADDATDIIANWIGDQILRADLAAGGIAVPEPSTDLTSAAVEANFVDAGTLWQQQPADPITDDVARAEYELGPVASGIICPSYLITDDAASADSIAEQIRSGAVTFAEAVESGSVDEATAATGGVVPCDDSANFNEQFQGAPDLLAAAFQAELGETVGPIDLGQVFVIMRLRPWEELEPGELDVLINSIPSRFELLTREFDVYVDPRFGTFEGSLGIRPLG